MNGFQFQNFHFFQESLTHDQIRAQHFFNNVIDSDSDDGGFERLVHNTVKITLPSKGHEQRLVLLSVVAPYAHTYLAVVHSLKHLCDYGMMESEFVRTCVKEITEKVEKFECKYGKMIWN